MNWAMVRFYKLGDPVAETVMLWNCKEYDRVRKILKERCVNCGYVCSTDPHKRFAIAGKDPVCELCCDMYKALTFNSGMRNMNYFREIQAIEDKAKNDRNNQRKRMGLDE